MSYLRIWVHLVFSTRDREPVLTADVRQELFKHIADNCKQKDIFLQAINGHVDHVHCLISLGKEQTIAKVCQLIKGESSFWINQNNLVSTKFAWQDDYFAVSVSESQVEAVVKYIKSQEQHHAVKTFAQEVDEFMNKYGWQVVN